MNKKIIPVYSFDELSDEAREKACQQVGDSMTDNAWWYEGTFDLFVERCKDYGMDVDENDIKFSGFGSQGDGASFVCDTIDTKKLLHNLLGIQINDELEEKVLDNIEVNIIRTSDRAYHEQTVHVELFISDSHDREIADTLEFKLEALKDDLCQQLYNDLEQEYNYLHSVEAVKEIAYGNNMLFLANGLVYDWGE